MLFHLVAGDDPDSGLRGLRGKILQAALGRDAKEDFLAVPEEPERAPGAEADSGLGAERAAEVGDAGKAQVGKRLGKAAEHLKGPAGKTDAPPPRQTIGRRLESLRRSGPGQAAGGGFGPLLGQLAA